MRFAFVVGDVLKVFEYQPDVIAKFRPCFGVVSDTASWGGGGGGIPSALGVRAARAKYAVVSEPERSVNQIEHVWANSEPTVTSILNSFVLPPPPPNQATPTHGK